MNQIAITRIVTTHFEAPNARITIEWARPLYLVEGPEVALFDAFMRGLEDIFMDILTDNELLEGEKIGGLRFAIISHGMPEEYFKLKVSFMPEAAAGLH